ncbi:MAG TPA: 2-C-methyl-D-erythritol 4-phosphate cytidylyltransferase [Syntrophales bacterium]|nr:2-C-methyl-D-erythritol 4-phosphate cytidylyltransferase [Syntrophales bacterium]
MKIVAIIPAGGSGKRMRENQSKQYLLLDGVPVLVHTLRVFQGSPMINEIFLIVPEDDIEFVRQSLVEKYDISKVSRILPGGRERQDSVKNGIDALVSDHDIVVIHDGVRPFVSEELVHTAIIEASNEDAATVGVPVKDTVKSVDDHALVRETLNRSGLWLTQTPQVFKLDVIKRAYEVAYEDNYYGTDDASLVERIGINVKMVRGSYDNIKITTKDDIVLAEGLIKRLKASSGI